MTNETLFVGVRSSTSGKYPRLVPLSRAILTILKLNPDQGDLRCQTT